MRHGLCLLIALALCGQICAENLLVNPSFENPAVTACTPNSQHPTSWQWTTTSWEWNSCSVLNGFLYNTSHNGPLPFYPTCSAFGDNYNTMSEWRSNQAVRDGYVYQTVSVTPGQTYLFSGQFAGMGSVGAEIYLQDGGYNSTKLNTATVRSDAAMDVEPGWSDWQFESVSATPTSAGGGQMTVVWHAHNISSVAPYENRAVFADALSLEACTAPVTLTGVVPPADGINTGGLVGGVNNSVLAGVQLIGTGFSGTPTVPTVMLIRSYGPLLNGTVQKGGQVIASNVQVSNNTTLLCDFNLNGVGPGKYDVAVKQDGCLATLSKAFLVAGATLMNGDFSLPTTPVDHGDCTTTFGRTRFELPTGWSTDAPSGLNRDGAAPALNGNCPSGHYASMSEGNGATVRAWQTVSVTPNWPYQFSGTFAAPTGVPLTLRLLDGDETGPEIASQAINHDYMTWTTGSVTGNARSSGLMTMVWEMQLSGQGPNVGGDAQNLAFATTLSCNRPIYDLDGDGDVDQGDFGILQSCFTGGTYGALTGACLCVQNSDGGIGQQEFTAFELCASGPDISAWPPADPNCE